VREVGVVKVRWLVVLGVVVALVPACDGGGTVPEQRKGASMTTGTPPSVVRAPLDVPAAYAGYRSEVYADPAHWVCRPDKVDTCDVSLDATSVAADGTLSHVAGAAPADPPIDCFYVYPTISRDPGLNSDLNAEPGQEGLAAAGQVAPLSPGCRVFAPTYRSATVSAVAASVRGETVGEEVYRTAFADVVDAWKHYLANDNNGRGVVLVGHSQGAGMLRELIRQEIDPHEDVRRFLVSAFIAGSAVRVPEGADVGGDFAEVPLCRRRDQVGCVVAWATYPADPGPPDDARFGRVREAGMAACVNPAAPAGGRAELHPVFGRTPGRGREALGGAPDTTAWVDPSKGEITTSFALLPGLFEGECVVRDGVSYLAIAMHAEPADPRIDTLDGGAPPDWGLHLHDVNLVMGDIGSLVAAQTEAFKAGG
jgi:hypothetical protein